MEPNCTEIPSTLIEDTVLEPVDKVIWLVMMMRACGSGGNTALPVYAELARSANVATKETVSRAISILRCRRWLTVCHTSWCKGGRRKSSAYALHTTPLPLQDAVYLDPHYPAFVQKSAGHYRARVQKVARDVLPQITKYSDGNNCNQSDTTRLEI